MNEENFGSATNETTNVHKMSLKKEEPINESDVKNENEDSSLSMVTEKLVQSNPSEDHFFYASPNTPEKKYYNTPDVETDVIIKEKGIHINPIVFLAAVVVAVLAIIVIKDMLHKEPGTLNGEYDFSYVEADGKEMDGAELLAWGVDATDMAITIDGDKAEIYVDGSGVECDFLVDGDEFTISGKTKSGETQEMHGEIDLYEETVTLNMDTGNVVFEKI